jgi:hypothetical protein
MLLNKGLLLENESIKRFNIELEGRNELLVK